METLNPMVLLGITMVFVTCVTKIKNCTNPQKKYEQWQKTEEYKEWDNSHLTGAADCNRVIKLDCIGHV